MPPPPRRTAQRWRAPHARALRCQRQHQHTLKHTCPKHAPSTRPKHTHPRRSASQWGTGVGSQRSSAARGGAPRSRGCRKRRARSGSAAPPARVGSRGSSDLAGSGPSPLWRRQVEGQVGRGAGGEGRAAAEAAGSAGACTHRTHGTAHGAICLASQWRSTPPCSHLGRAWPPPAGPADRAPAWRRPQIQTRTGRLLQGAGRRAGGTVRAGRWGPEGARPAGLPACLPGGVPRAAPHELCMASRRSPPAPVPASPLRTICWYSCRWLR